MMDENEIKYDNKKMPAVSPSENRAKKRIFKPKIDLKLCDKCMLCAAYCPENCIKVQGEPGQGRAEVDYNHCKGCMICMEVCPSKAVEKEREKE